ncbi:MAG: bifunctional diaminohydroxyphosphoribosylaminopyrimidine deaminase/5-amino-6-(5-phosphoribosylamino)uracil reductase RibD [Bacteroidetes bacterium]|nr:MAG: bifunctional diaminohydroxyphosphoribosylaminopyrimidine deaminase/5-amino-6-(5-phosphoribosylamino)uracil reductase RibD [Bacteroidota bacterium]MBL1145886.1 bifunctional diaminohydroxyphosphoribosylaminopyrimidine deaminase/5-amino-6-(5-phosphoribosylamino)uracil reductase RibD [Bacteroidota bacterium]NOG58680.1 bifunctional diaminohydroxyphosphoribosylaminopyrimidine deaminase/5-amino-6-(5-phosphoribosylamino)uracil reductase RibD [Bacteroidota bacterium]
MLRCFELAQKGKFTVSPNPRVGSVIVHENRIIGEGYHQNYGEAHAEVNAINSVKDKSLLKDSTLYVNLEPCSHFGKTPPCSDLIIQHKIPHVVVSNKDPFKEVNGGGISRLTAHGIKVTTGVLTEAGEELNKRFFTFHQKKRPYIILKWAETCDGFISRNQEEIKTHDNWITTAQSKQLVHAWRAEETGILVGKNTVLADNPSLTCREVAGKSPIRIIIDPHLELSLDFTIFNQEVKTLIINTSKNEIQENLEFHQIDFEKNTIQNLLDKLYQLNIQSLLVEGGAYTLQQFLNSQLWDEARVFKGIKKFEKGISAPQIVLKPISSQTINTDTLTLYNRLDS